MYKLFCTLILLHSMHSMAFDQLNAIEYQFKNFDLKVPGNIQSLQTFGDDSEVFITFKYSSKLAGRYISISKRGHDIPKAEKEKGCDLDTLLKGAYLSIKQTACKPERVKIYKDVFFTNRTHDHWKRDGYDFYYSSAMPGSSHLFVVAPDKTTIRIDSDFFTKADFQLMVDAL